jgi:hypothetical protein
VTGIFKANNPSNNFGLLLYGLVLKLPLFLYPMVPQVQSSDAVIYRSFIAWSKSVLIDAPIIYSMMAFLLLYVQAISFNTVVNNQRMLQRPNYLTGMCYLLITSIFAEWFSLSAALIVNTALIWVWSKLCSLHNNPSAKSTIYNIGAVIGLATFFYYPAITFSFLFMVGLAIARPFRLNEWLIGLLGLATTFYFFAAWLFLSDQWTTYTLPKVLLSVPVIFEKKLASTALGLVLSAMLLGTFFIQNNMRRQIVQVRKSWQLVYLYLLVAVLVPFLNADNSFSSWILVAIPASLLTASAFFYPDKKWFGYIIHWGMVAVSVAVAYFVR